MDILDESILALWRSLHTHEVKYIMIGGFAVYMNGFHRFTEDVDILIEDSAENRRNFRSALKQANIGDFASLETMDIIPGMTSIMLDGGMELDIFDTLPGYAKSEFQDLWIESNLQEIEGVPVRFLHINQLIRSKKATKRPKDIVDVSELEKIRNINPS